LNAPEIKADITGSEISAWKEKPKIKGQINGSGNIRAYDMKSEDVDVEILGSGNAEVFASEIERRGKRQRRREI
jgi:hypothetical protein